MNYIQIQTGRENLKAVREFFRRHPGAKQSDCSKALGISVMAVGRHVKTIRAEWQKPDKRKR